MNFIALFRLLAPALIVIVLLTGGLYFYRRAVLDHAAVRAAQTQERTRINAEDAARAAERDGADRRLRDGTYFHAPVP